MDRDERPTRGLSPWHKFARLSISFPRIQPASRSPPSPSIVSDRRYGILSLSPRHKHRRRRSTPTRNNRRLKLSPSTHVFSLLFSLGPVAILRKKKSVRVSRRESSKKIISSKICSNIIYAKLIKRIAFFSLLSFCVYIVKRTN